MSWNKKNRSNGSKFVSIDEKNTEFKGVLLGLIDNQKYKDKKDFLFRAQDGSEVVVNSSKILSDGITQVGAAYHIVFLGRAPTKQGQPVKLYDVYETNDPEIIAAFVPGDAREDGEVEGADDSDLPF